MKSPARHCNPRAHCQIHKKPRWALDESSDPTNLQLLLLQDVVIAELGAQRLLTHPQTVFHANEGKIPEFQLQSLNRDSNLHFKTTTILKMCQKQSIFAKESQKIFEVYFQLRNERSDTSS